MKIFRLLNPYNVSLFVEQSTIDDLQKESKETVLLQKFPKYQIFDKIKNENDIDLALAVGGDGTILWTVSLFQNRDVPPIIGFSKVL